jgi:formylglycine-generating enzyme required for sulfatase activity
MTDNSFQTILTKVISERGVAILDNTAKCNGLLLDYANGGFKLEIRLFLQALEAGYQKELLNSTEPEITKPILAKKFHDEYGISKEVAEETVRILATVLEDGGKSEEEKIAEKIAKLEKAAKDGDIQSQYELGVLFRKLKKFEEAAKWLELAAKRGLELYVAQKQKNREEPEKIKKTGTVSAEYSQPVPGNMVLIRGGTFMMGSPDNEADRGVGEILHEVKVSSFFMSKCPLTQKEYKEVMWTNPSNFKGDDLPVERVSWYDAIEYCNKLSQQEGLTPTYFINGTNVFWDRNTNGYRLPTEAEWEYACRAGTATPFSTGNNILTSQANFDGTFPYNISIKGEYREKTTSVGIFVPNPWGLYDMHGNVDEWCWDLYGKYLSGIQTDPVGASSGSVRVNRGGSWSNSAGCLRSACRKYNNPFNLSYYMGFRLARNAE